MKKLLLTAAAAALACAITLALAFALAGCAPRPTPELLCENLKGAFELVCEYELSGQDYTMSFSRSGAADFSAELYAPDATPFGYVCSGDALTASHAGLSRDIDPGTLPGANVFMGLRSALTRASPERCVSCETRDGVVVCDFGDFRISAVNSVPVAVEWGAVKLKITAFTLL